MSDEIDAPDAMGAAAKEFILYSALSGSAAVRVLVEDETVWLPQKAIAELFSVGVPAISKHLKNIFESGELSPEATISKMENVGLEGQREVSRRVDFYSLDAIIAVGYRVNSYEATQFRIWATRTLREYPVKGFVLDDERLKRGSATFGKDYFDELVDATRGLVVLELGVERAARCHLRALPRRDPGSDRLSCLSKLSTTPGRIAHVPIRFRGEPPGRVAGTLSRNKRDKRQRCGKHSFVEHTPPVHASP
ncbi:MAG: virulence RhuM family protein [Sandaracinaceae bacterium]|nr:virulence RhuM family protein [Sandaracinaceae bacterium]